MQELAFVSQHYSVCKQVRKGFHSETMLNIWGLYYSMYMKFQFEEDYSGEVLLRPVWKGGLSASYASKWHFAAFL